MEVVNIAEAKAQLSHLIEEVLNGKEIVIGRRNKPLVTLKPFELPQAALPKRKGGQLKGKIWVADDFDAPDPEIESWFYDGPLFPD